MFKLFLAILLLPLSLSAQTPDTLEIAEPRHDLFQEMATVSGKGGEVRLYADSAVTNLLKWHIALGEKKKTFSGYRIQILSVNSYDCDVEKLKETRMDFEKTFMDIPAYLKYFDPDFKIRAGNFHNRLESIPTLHRIRRLYPSSYPVKTEIRLEELKRIPLQELLEEEEAEEDNLSGSQEKAGIQSVSRS